MSGRVSLVALLVLASAAHAGAQRDRQIPGRDRVAEPVGTAVIAGVVVTADSRQQPVRRVSVLLASGPIVVPRMTMTDDQGRFEFSGLAAGHYTLVGQKPAWVSAVYGARSSTDNQGIPIAVVDGQRLQGLRLPMMRGAVVAGVVRLAGGQPAQGITVQVLRVRVVDGRRQLSTMSSGAQTDDRGVYRAFGLAPGDYVVQARRQSNFELGTVVRQGTVTRQVTDAEVRWADQLLASRQAASMASAPAPGPPVAYSTVFFPGTTFASDAAVVALLPGEERLNVDFALSFVPTATVTGTVVGADGSPAAGAMISIDMEDGDADVLSLMLGRGRVTTRPDGTFALPGVGPGRYSLTVRATPRRPGATPPAPGDAAFAEAMAMAGALSGLIGGGRENPATLWASEVLAVNGQDVGPLTLQLREGLTIEGTVVVDGGDLPPDVAALRIGVSPPASGDPDAAMMARAMDTATGVVTAEGTFVVRGLIPGKYQVSVSGKPMRLNAIFPGMPPSDKGWVVRSIQWGDQDLADSGVDVRADRPLTGVVVTLTHKPTQLGGTVIDAANRPVDAFPIVVFSQNRAFWGAGSRRVVKAQPASDGSYAVTGLPAGAYYLAAVTSLEPGEMANPQFLEDLVPLALRLTIADGEKKIQDLKLAGGD